MVLLDYLALQGDAASYKKVLCATQGVAKSPAAVELFRLYFHMCTQTMKSGSPKVHWKKYQAWDVVSSIKFDATSFSALLLNRTIKTDRGKTKQTKFDKQTGADKKRKRKSKLLLTVEKLSDRSFRTVNGARLCWKFMLGDCAATNCKKGAHPSKSDTQYKQLFEAWKDLSA